ncbi:MAG: murein L,D-transpeptidase YcbB/YkuD [Psychromonas sp.]|jgi:murein L,D-transpeptidase YcbB/YkuD|uniref:L,D-transpeptidase family protein n=1 Tax=Psychromonas sp. TaxID=1884585 RepID=UPI0039E59BCA
MMKNHLLKFLLSITIFCLLGFIPASSSALESHNATDLQLKYPALLESIYQNHPDHRFWQEESLRDEFEKQILLLVAAGISDDLSAYYQALKKASGEHDWQLYERLASDSLLFYISYTEQISSKGTLWLFAGKIDNNIGVPSKKSTDPFFNAPSQDRLQYLQSLLPAATRHSRLYHYFLSSYLTRHNKLSSAKFTVFAKQGEKLQQKDQLLARLQISGEISDEMKQYLEAQDRDRYSEELQDVVQHFQARHGLIVDGIIGKNTQYWLNISHDERLRLMALNILRLQLWVLNKPRMILVNIPDYSMEYWESGQKTFTSKVIVGRVERKTPLFSSRLDSIVFNPSWYVPTTIMRKDILPYALIDQDFFEQNNYEIVPTWRSEEVINEDEIEWTTITAESFPYKLRQKPGKTNALGLYKFNTPNKNAIYLHDTPAKQLFDRQYRAYSSGCIRVQDADKFAQLLMEKSGFSEEEYQLHLQQEKTKVVSLKKKITVYTIYQTVWVDQLGFTQFRKDIYDYDKLSELKLP